MLHSKLIIINYYKIISENLLEIFFLRHLNLIHRVFGNFYHYRRELVLKKQPNRAHKALVAFENKILSQTPQKQTFTVISQNVDGWFFFFPHTIIFFTIVLVLAEKPCHKLSKFKFGRNRVSAS